MPIDGDHDPMETDQTEMNQVQADRMQKSYDIKHDVQLPIPVAIWVLSAHLYALVVPLVLLAAIYRHWSFLQANSAYPFLFYLSVALMMAGIAFEIAQNAIDRWYLTPECGSAEGTGFCDFVSFWVVLLAQALMMMAFQGQHAGVVLLGVVAVAVFPVLYTRQTGQFVPTAIVGLGAAISAYLRLGDPVVFLQLLMTVLTLTFFGGLLKSGNQVLHGFTTVAATSGILFLAWGIHGGATGAPQSWMFVALVAVAAVVIAILLRTRFESFRATVRPRYLGGPPA